MRRNWWRLVRKQWITLTVPLAVTGGVAAGWCNAQDMAVQTDWSGGPGVAGPVSEWAETFNTTSDIAWRSIAGQLALAGVPRAAGVQTGIRRDGEFTGCIAIADLNGDGKPELITVDPVTDPFTKVGAIYWWDKPDGSDIWRRHFINDGFYGGEYATSVDVDKDGDLDVILAAYYGDDPELGRDGKYAWFENLNGDASAWEYHLLGEYYWGANYIDSGDLDGDGDIDLVGASELTDGGREQNGDIVWFENLDGNGDSWQAHDVAIDFDNASQAHMVDLDGDLDLDIVATNSNPFGQSQMHWWENVNGDASAWTKWDIPGSFWSAGYVDIGDIDDDGDMDLIGGGYHTSTLFWWENLDGKGTSWAVYPIAIFPSGLVIELADLDGDGDLDAAGAGDNASLWGGIWWYENRWNESFQWVLREIRHNSGSSPWMDVGDINGDGRLDVAVCVEDPYNKEEFDLSWWDITTFKSDGMLESSVLDLGAGGASWGAIDWDCDVPLDTTVSVDVRASNDAQNLGAYVPVSYSGSDLGSVVDPGLRYVQYRLTLASSDPEYSPIVRDLRIALNGKSDLWLDAPTPGIAGRTNELSATWTEPNAVVGFAYSLSRGMTRVPGCHGLAVHLSDAQLIKTARTDETGTAAVQVKVPGQASGLLVHFQAVVPGDCVVSNVVSWQFE